MSLPTPTERLLNYPMPGPTGPVQDYPGYEPARRRRTPWTRIALTIAPVIIVVLSAIVVVQFESSESGTTVTAAPQPTELQPAPQQPKETQQLPSSPAAQSMTCDGLTASVDANSQPGWQAAINRFGLAYAVPPEWNRAECGVRMGWAQPCPAGQCVVREISAATSIANPTCPKQNLAMAGVTASKSADLKAALDDEVKTIPAIYARHGQGPPKIDFAPVREFMIGAHPAVQTVATVSGMTPDSCNGSSALHSIVVTTVPNVEGSVVFLISLRQGANTTPKPDVINKIVATLQSPA